MQAGHIITLTTDFGLADPYVGQLKGAILRRNPAARIVDLSHAVPRQDIPAAGFVLRSSYRFFPAATVHLAIVDPGVGTGRDILLAVSEDQLFIAPDNGVLSPFFAENRIMKVYRIENSVLFASSISSTFHGRDIMAPVAAALAGGLPPSEVGPEVAITSCIRLDFPTPIISGNRIEGQVLQIDHFGNIRSNIRSVDLESFTAAACRITVKDRQTFAVRSTYADAAPGELIALIDSGGFLELAVNMGSAARSIRCRIGDLVTVTE